MTVHLDEGRREVQLVDGEEVVVEGRSLGDLDLTPPETVGADVASDASRGFPWYEGHPFPTCFVCGPRRPEGDGLRIFAGRAPGGEVYACPWTPAVEWDEGGRVADEIVWAALDCPSWFGILEFGTSVRYALLGELTARIIERPPQDSRCVIVGWSSGREARKLHGGTAIYAESGALVATSAATWIELKDAPYAKQRVA